MRGIVFYKHLEAGKNQFRDIIKSYARLGIKVIKYQPTKTYEFVMFDNKDIWKLTQIDPRMRGERYNIAYIERSIDEETVHTAIFPGLIAIPYHAYNYYN